MAPPVHHKEVAKFLHEMIPGEVRVIAYRDNSGERPVPIGHFGPTASPFFSTIGAFDERKAIPIGDYEFAACGTLEWLPNSIASSIYWLKGREITEWPLVCEDVVRDNARSTYRHMAYVPSMAALSLSTGQRVQWLLGVPITDRDISLGVEDVTERARAVYPAWLLEESA